MPIKFYTTIVVAIATIVIAGCEKEQAQTDPVAQAQEDQAASVKPMTISEVESQGARKLNTEEIKNLIVGKMVSIKRLSSGEEITGYYNEDGTRTLIEFDKGVAIQGGNATGATRDPYSIDNDQLHAILEGREVSTTVYQLGERYLAASSEHNGVINFEVFPPGRK